MDGGSATAKVCGTKPAGLAEDDAPADAPAIDFTSHVGHDPEGHATLSLLVEGAHCGGCVARIERALAARPEVTHGRLNLTTKRLAIAWSGPDEAAAPIVKSVTDLGFGVVPYDPTQMDDSEQRDQRRLLRCTAVAGFAAANVMLLSVSVWAGAAQGMEEGTRAFFHWLSALIVLPAVAYAGRPFFASALAALKAGHTNMDVPISLAVLLASGMSLAETMRGAEHVYFDSAITLLFFLLIGRFLDRRARGRARSAAHRLLALAARAITVVGEDGRQTVLPPGKVRQGMTVLVAAGERVAVDGVVTAGRSDLDTSLITGEMVPAAVGPGERIFAGMLNQTAPLTVTVSAIGDDTLLGEIVRLMEAAEQRKARYVAIADRISRLYAPAVHALAAAAFLGWMLLGGIAWQPALLIAVSVLIVTCPCALGLAVPAVQVIASGRLMRGGTLLKTGTALERFAQVDTVVFDKTGTLTVGRPSLDPASAGSPEVQALAVSLAAASRHPLSRALVRALGPGRAADGVREVAGFGLALETPDGEVRLGRRDWCSTTGSGTGDGDDATGPELWLARPGAAPHCFRFEDALRADAADVVAKLQARGLGVEILSGDRPAAVAAVAAAVGIDRWTAATTPADKVARLETLAAEGRRVLMVGDGLNDVPALAAAYVSLSPSSAIDISQTAADAVFQGRLLAPVVEVLTVARRAGSLVTQNFALAFCYNLIAVPIAMAGWVTPLVAAVCMSSSSLVVVGNALRLAGRRTAASR
ncbi:MAG: heavy metal translocating P-type ATPase [Rhodospirillaceae bacterium]|nr:heavy metal translocating P-type ATPase [Rhodospirillaceae bacterium]